MNNEISNNPCGCGKCEPMCTTCGRPWVVCKGDCGCKKPCCNRTNFCEYGRMAKGCIRERQPECPMQAVIPSVVVDSVSNLKNLADCFVHVTSINTTFYIDDKHRMMITWAGPVEYNNYDVENNPLGLRSQTVYDYAAGKAIYYNATGEYKEFSLGGGGGNSDPVYIELRFPQTTEWMATQHGTGLNIDFDLNTASGRKVGTREVPSPTYRNLDTDTDMTAEEVFNLLESETNVVFLNVPIGWTGTGMAGTGVTEPDNNTDGLKMTARKEYYEQMSETDSSTVVEYSGVAFANGLPLGYGMARHSADGEPDYYMFFTQGVDNFPGFN